MQGLDEERRERALAYKLDNAGNWILWLAETNTNMTSRIGQEAPHSFFPVRRKNLGTAVGDGKAGWTTADENLSPGEKRT